MDKTIYIIHKKHAESLKRFLGNLPSNYVEWQTPSIELIRQETYADEKPARDFETLIDELIEEHKRR
jgi:hypothetical protein